MNIDLKSPNWGPLLHGGIVWLITDGLPVLDYLQKQFTNQDTHFDINRFLVGLGAAVVTALISAGRNQGGITLSKNETGVIKGIQAIGGEAVMAQARDVIPNTENVIVLRDRPATEPEPPAPQG